ncbi:MAG: S1C family serine protease [Solirubrobacterales bacterium]
MPEAFGLRRWAPATLALAGVLLAAAPAVAARRAAPAVQPSAAVADLLDRARFPVPGAEPVGRITVVNATSQTLLREQDVDFPLSLGIDLPLDVKVSSLGDAIGRPQAETGRFILVFDVALAKASRRVRDVKSEESWKVTSWVHHRNPEYEAAFDEAKRQARLAISPSLDDLLRLPSLADLGVDEEQEEGVTPLDAAKRRLVGLSRTIDVPVYGRYRYRVGEVEARKALTVNVTLVDRQERTVRRSVFDVAENQQFTPVYDVDDTDPFKGSILAEHAAEKDIKDWERAPVVVDLGRALAAAGKAKARPYRPAALTRDLARDRSAALARAVRDDRFDDRPLDDPRFDSVVVIYQAKGMGSGFYVRPDIVMTNWHVVEDLPLVEMRLYDKRETFGQVIAKDVVRDLALVKVQTRGRPVAFYQGRQLHPGMGLETIGHPLNATYTVTRGVVSAVRHRDPGAPTRPGDRNDVLYVQTDAEISPGSSGGPVFLGDRVVGIATWGVRSRTDGQTAAGQMAGISFAVHYAEALRFLAAAMRGE